MSMISACKNLDELVSIFSVLCKKYFLHYNVRVNDFINITCKEKEFKESKMPGIIEWVKNNTDKKTEEDIMALAEHIFNKKYK